MRMKLHRKRRVFRTRSIVPRIILWIVVAAAIITLGFFGAKYLTEHPFEPSTEQSSSQDSQVDSAPAESNSTTDTSEAETPATPSTPTHDNIRGFYLPTAALQDMPKLNQTLEQAAGAGFTHVIFDLKDSDGNLYFRSETTRAAQANAYAETALSIENTEALFTAIREAGLAPIPRLYAFMDNKASRTLASARITPQGNPTYTWYDGVYGSKDARSWLNPYADEAQLYIIELAKELRDLGAAGILLDGVQFPRQTASAYFGDSTLTHSEVLTAFVDKARTMLGENCPVLLSCSANGALGTDTVIYGGNPLTFTPTVASPMLLTGTMPTQFTVGNESVDNTPDNLTATLKTLVSQLALRIKVMPQDSQPTLTPWLQAQDYTPAQIKAAIQGCTDGGTNGYIMYEPNGVYDFAALQ